MKTRYRFILLCVMLAALAVCFASCASHSASPVLPVPKAVQVSDKVQAVVPSVDRASEANAQLRGQLAPLRDQARSAREAAEAAMNEAGRLVTVGKATQLELDHLWSSLQAIQSRNLFVEAELEKTVKLVDSQAHDLQNARASLNQAVASAGAADQAASYLTDQLGSVTRQFSKAEEKRQSLAAIVAVKDAQLHQSRRWLLILAVVCAVYVVLRLLKLTLTGRLWLFWLP